MIKKSGNKGEALRAQTILMLEQKTPYKTIAVLTGFSRTHAFRLRREYIKNGIGAISDKRKGKPKELLKRKEMEEIVKTLKTKTPKDVGYVCEYWTAGILGDWIEQKYEVKYKSKTSLYLVFKKAEFTYHKPGRVYRERDEKEVAQWRKQTKPKIDKLLKTKAVILAEDEMILTTRTTIQKVWLPSGQYPKIECSTGGRKRRNIYGFLNIRTGKEHAFKTEEQNMFVTKDILAKLRKIYPKEKIALLWDNAGWHRGSQVMEFIKKDSNIEIIHFPKYAPEENPQEHVWKNGRSKITHNRFIEDIDEATDEFVKYLNETKFNYELLESAV